MSKRVFICSNPSMFSQGIEACIVKNPDLDLVGRADDPDTAIRLIKKMKPDVVLLVSGERERQPWLAVQNLLNEGIDAKIIDLDLQSELVGVYLGEKQKVEEFDDLVKIILEDVRKFNHSVAITNKEKEK